MRDEGRIDREEEVFAERVAAPLRASESLDATFDARLMAAVRADAVARRVAEERTAAPGDAADTTSRRTRLWRWLAAPRMVPLSPALVAGGVLAIAAIAGVWRGGVSRTSGETATLRPAGELRAAIEEDPHVVRFVLVAPAASSVSLVGDFNGWDPGSTLLRATTVNGVWMVDVPLPPGRHLYAFLVDGERWMTDPAAPMAIEDDFGTPNSVVTVPERVT